MGDDPAGNQTLLVAFGKFLDRFSVKLQPWHANISKRLIKSPKLYFYDVGLAAFLLGLERENHVARDPLRGKGDSAT
jgi:predicted AAA+ superfamily ATPase